MRLAAGLRNNKKLSILCVIVAILAVALIVLKLNPPSRAQQAIMIREAEPGDIRNVRIDNGYGQFEIRYTGEGYEVHDIPAPLVDYDRFMRLMRFCSTPRAVRIIDVRERREGAVADNINHTYNEGIYACDAANSDDASTDGAHYAGASVDPFGLEPPYATAHIKYESGSDLAIYIGRAEPVSKSVYFSVGGSSDIYMMDAASASDFTCPPKGYISKRVTENPAISSPLSSVIDASFFGGELARPVVIESVAYGGDELKRQALSFGAASHLVHLGDDTFELDQTYGIEILGSLLGITAYDVVAYNCTDSELEAKGFKAPWIYVDFDYVADADGNAFNLSLSVVPSDGGQYLVRRNAEDIIYVTGRQSFMSIDESRLMNRWYLSPFIMDLCGVTVDAGGLVLDFELGGETNALKTVKLNSEDYDIAVFRKLYRLLTSASNDGELLPHTEIAASGEPLITLQYFFTDEQKPPDRIEFYRAPDAARKLIVVINGNPVEYGMRDKYASRVFEACLAILEGRDFDTDW